MQCKRRLRKCGKGGHSGDFYFASLDGNLVLDAGPMGSEARFANHSCSPNCQLQKWSVQGETRVVLAAMRDLEPGEELTYNYQADTLGGFVDRQRCQCGARMYVCSCAAHLCSHVLTIRDQRLLCDVYRL